MSATRTQLPQFPIDINVEETLNPQELGYQLWAYVLSRNAKAVGKKLNIPERTVQDWVSRHKWAERAANELRGIAPAVDAAVGADIRLAALEAMPRLRRILRGEEDADKTVLAAIGLAMDLAGYGGRRGVAPAVPPPEPTADLSHLSIDELMALERGKPTGGADSPSHSQ